MSGPCSPLASPPDGVPEEVRRCWRGPAYHWHWEGIALLLLGLAWPALGAIHLPGLFGDGIGLVLSVFVISPAGFFVGYAVASRHVDPDSLWVSDGDCG